MPHGNEEQHMATSGEGRARSREYQLVYSRLLTAAQEKSLVSYSEVLSLAASFAPDPDSAPPAGEILKQIAADEHASGRPLLSALVVTGKNIPGDAFFAAARQLGRLEGADAMAEMRFWQAEERRVYDAWRRV
jgi:hypothetical protein